MPSIDPYFLFMSGVQALRRRAEAYTWGVNGALGVAADPYPHQITTVRRILSDTRIRHLVADEVGLGKTIQALMVINALRMQNPSHKTVVVAPERLLGQWQREAWTRGHVKAAVVGSEEVERGETPSILLVRPRDIQDNSEILAPDERHLIVVDEPQSMPLEVVDRIAQYCSGLRTTTVGRFRQVLVLSATPRLGDARWRDLIFEMIEPELKGIADQHNTPIFDLLAAREAVAVRRLDELSGNEKKSAGRLAFQCSAITRRISRQSRKAWAKYLPAREIRTVLFEPAQAEVERIVATDSILAQFPNRHDQATSPWIQVKAMARSRRSVRAALDQLSNQVDKRTLATIRDAATHDPVDSRFEALLDVLSSEWSSRPNEKFIIVAGDGLTIDMLCTALPRYIEELRNEGAIATLKRPPGATEETAIDIQQMHAAVTPFIEGEARVLILGDWVQAGLNLHHAARNIIFYSVPWDPVAIDQLIGRIDRLRKGGLQNATDENSFGRIKIWRLIMQGSMEERVTKTFDTIRLFDRPIPQLSEEDTQTITDAIEAAAREKLPEDSIAKLAELSLAWDGQSLPSALSDFDQTSPDLTNAIAVQLANIKPIEPTMCADREGQTNTLIAERSNEAFLRILDKGNIYSVSYRQDRVNQKIQFKTLWYTQGAVGFPAPLSDIGTDNWNSDHAVFLTRREHMSAPPKTKVVTDEGEEHGRLLRFFDHGESLHDDIVDGLKRLCDQNFDGSTQVPELSVLVNPEHPLARHQAKSILLSVGFTETANSIEYDLVPRALQKLASDDTTQAQRTRMMADIREFTDGLQADDRWLSSTVPPQLYLYASAFENNAWTPLPDNMVAELFKPLGEDGKFRPAPKPLSKGRAFVGSSNLERCKSSHEIAIKSRLAADGKRLLASLAVELSERLSIIASDAETTIELRSGQREARKSDVVGDFQREMLRGQLAGLEKRIELADLARRLRRQTLSRGADTALNGRPVSVWHLCIRFICPS
ncbi:DEAD/DEAH box helicase [Agrobacterium genomosp. 2]|uniref:Helicase domain protein n=1 Tax=Agrobacterium genomosp. 2 str. CFBP 5494 TaxID=1183436 RepID=A0A9W5F092_9HYPH|nr:DEAD/DEAH box helicase [Agrobacterium genomosp. 2]CUW93645.1 putative Helicase domain protein [Agrobacterium genomosp. 2 str. CFBP 5494]